MANDFTDWQSGEQQHGHGNVLVLVHRLLRGRMILTLVLAAVMALCGALVGYFSQEPMYQSRGTIRIRPRVEKVLYENDQNTSPREFSGLVSSQVGYLESNRVLSLALSSDRVQELQAVSGLYSPEQIASGLRVSSDRKKPEFIYVNYEHIDRNVARAVVTSVIDAYMELFGNLENLSSSPEVVNKLEEKLLNSKKERDNIKNQIQILTNEWGSEDIGMLVRNAIAKVRQYESQEIDLQKQIGQYEAYAQTSSEGEEEPALTVERAAALDEQMAVLLSKRISLENGRADMMTAGYGEKHREVKMVNAAIESVNRQIDARMEEIRSGDAQVPGLGPSGTAASIDELKYQLRDLGQRLAAAKEAQRLLGNADLKMKQLVTEFQQAEDKVKAVNTRLDEIETESSTEDFREGSQRISVVEKGVTPSEPSSDRRRKYAAMGFLGAGSVPVVAMLAIGLFSRSVRFSDDQILSDSQGIIGMLPDLGDSLGDQELAEASAFAVHQIRSQLQILHNHRDHGHVYEVTSPSSQDGKTSLIIAMGLSFAESGDRTLLLDLDLIGRGLSIHFGRPNSPSLVDGIMTPERVTDLVVDTDFAGLSVLPAGFGDDAEISRLSPTAIRKLLDVLRDHYDTVLVDTGPILGSIEAGFLAAEADGVILVVGRGQLRPLIRRAIDQINGVGGKIVATIFNRASGYELRQSTGTMSVHFSRQAARQAAEAAARSGPRVGPVAGTLFADRAKTTKDTNSKAV
ncbi:MAG: AAA family ATPase [Phycisphaerales bacterium]|nr:AAA family ATPase [Phycisphaerales bacterium]